MRLLVIEDNPRLGLQISKVLEEQGYVVDVSSTGHQGEEMAASQEYDAIVMDVMLPDHDGVQICKNLRRLSVATPVLLLTALSDTSQKVAGLEAGADDYLTKPFEMSELVARIRALLRRSQAQEGTVLRFQNIEMDLAKRTVSRDDQHVRLTTKEFALLEFFLRNPDRVLSRSTIGQRVWDLAFEDESNVIEVYVSRLRNKIDKGFDKPLIHTVIGAGYILSAEGPPG